MYKLQNYISGQWITGDGDGQQLYNAVTAEPIASASTKGLDFKSITDYARTVGNPALRTMTFHARGNMLKALALHLRPIAGLILKAASATCLPTHRCAANFRMMLFV
jgi:oxepin-CoA hydrolase / 3-oxo-5,6-dehydrosuberyl-CoA semialdehyde dehydrogenase